MAKYLITGGKKLQGKIRISGNKNSVLPCLAACLLTADEVILDNVPNISDVAVLCGIMETLGSKVIHHDHSVTISTPAITNPKLPQDQVNKLRASILLVGPLLARFGKADFFHPGGDVIGKRSIDTHLMGFEELGYKISVNDREYHASKSWKMPEKKEIFLDEPSVTATENLILAAVIGSCKVTLKNCAKEPHVVDLCTLLNQMGAKIEGIGGSSLVITGVQKLNGTRFSIGPDFLELGTYAIAAAITGGKIEIENCDLSDLEPVLHPLRRMGISIEKKNDSIVTASASDLKAFPHLKTNIWPGFPSDMMSVMIVLATQAKGVSLMHDWMYESRMFFADKLISMGASITIADPHRVLVYGPTQLTARSLETPDIRAGMALVLASLIAKGTSTIYRSELIERGYEDVVEKLASLGAQIENADSRN
jgi:UDP-N-acetylglucosamine 1-carboxyvinyltransferase